MKNKKVKTEKLQDKKKKAVDNKDLENITGGTTAGRKHSARAILSRPTG